MKQEHLNKTCYRINVIELKVPSLRERPEDIPVLADKLLNGISEKYGIDMPAIGEDAMSVICRYQFPGNVRELENILERAITFCEDNTITPEDLNLTVRQVILEALVGTDSETDSVNADNNEINETIIGEHEAPKTNELPGSLPENEDSLESYLVGIEKDVIVDALEANRWNKTAAAKKLGITFRALRYRLKKLGLE